MQNAHLATQLARMLESGCSLPESLATLFPESIPASASAIPASNAEATDASASPAITPDSAVLHQLPPLVRWAIDADPDDEPLSNLLRFVSATYRQMAERQEKLWRVIAPTICGLLIGGAVVLGYGLSLFLPVIQLLKDLATPGSGVGGI